MRHPNDGTVRRLVDDPGGVADRDREHIAACSRCLDALTAARSDAEFASLALAVDTDTDTDAAWQRLSMAGAAEAGQSQTAKRATPRNDWRNRLRSPAVAAVGVAAALAGAGTAAANNWFQIFEAEQVAPVTLSQADLLQLPDLSEYGDLRVLTEPQLREVASAEAAEEATGLDVPEIDDLPGGVVGDPVFQTGSEATAVFTFSAAQARQVAAENGEPMPEVPPGLDQAQFQLSAGPGVASMYESSTGLPAMVVARAVAPSAASSSVPFDTARDYLLTLPGIPEDLARQLAGFADDGTVPVPVPQGEVQTSTVDIHGAQATVFAIDDGTLTGVVWIDDGVLTAVAGSLSEDEVVSVARDLEFEE